MSVINKMLQELDRRNASASVDAEQAPQQVRVLPPKSGHEWFWRVVAALMLASVAWVAWVAVQLQLRPSIVTPEAFSAAEQARRGPILAAVPSASQQRAPSVAASPQPPASPPPQAEAQGEAEEKSTDAAPARRESAETFKLAQSIGTPVAERPAAPSPAPAPEPAKPSASTPPAAKATGTAKPTATARPTEPAKPLVSKRDHSRSAFETAEAQFRRAAVYLNQGRVSEAESQLIGALHADPSHVGARQAYVALLLEQKRTDAAKRVLKEALAKDPAQPLFSLALARILAEQRDYAGALEVMENAGSVARNADFQAVRGAVMQRLGRHQEAVDAYLAAIQGGVQPAATWVGLGISLEALGRKAEAAQAYRRSLGGVLAPEVREYADSRARALE